MSYHTVQRNVSYVIDVDEICCDRCGDCEDYSTGSGMPKGWATLVSDDVFKHVCPECLGCILEVIRNRA